MCLLTIGSSKLVGGFELMASKLIRLRSSWKNYSSAFMTMRLNVFFFFQDF
jgi:hypothetical protein